MRLEKTLSDPGLWYLSNQFWAFVVIPQALIAIAVDLWLSSKGINAEDRMMPVNVIFLGTILITTGAVVIFAKRY